MNGYAYANANPVNLVDPTGLIGERPPTCQNSLNSSFQDCGDCIAPPSGSIRFSPCGIKPEIDDMALYTKGILFTIGCGVTGTWDNVNKQAISDAINLIESKGINFLQTFGGLELRLVTDITASDSNPIAQTDRPRTSVIHFDPDWVTFAQGASTGDAVRNVIHELGHILDYRTRSIENGMFVAAVRTNDTIYSDSLASGSTWLLSVSALSASNVGVESPDAAILERIANFFTFWVEGELDPLSEYVLTEPFHRAALFANGSSGNPISIDNFNKVVLGFLEWSRLAGTATTTNTSDLEGIYLYLAARAAQR